MVLPKRYVVFAARNKIKGLDEEFTKLFMTVLPVCQACIAVRVTLLVKHAIRNVAQRAARIVVDAERRARRDARSSVEVERLGEVIETTNNVTPRRGRGRGNRQRNTKT